MRRRILELQTVVLATLLSLTCSSRADNPGDIHHIRPDDLPKPFATAAASNPPRVVPDINAARLKVPVDFKVEEWASGFGNPRQALVMPNGDVLVVESNASKVSLLRDTDKDGKADFRSPVLTGLTGPFGIQYRDGWLYVANTNSVVRARYAVGDNEAQRPAETVIPNIPAGGHWTRDILFSPDGSKLYVSVGSSSNLAEEEPRRAAILEFNPDGTGQRIYAGGLRNPVDMAWHPRTNELWTTVNERDGLGDDLPPDYTTSVRDGGFYGWPYAYIGSNPEPRMDGKRPDLVAESIVPDVLIQAHSAPLGLMFYTGSMFPAEYRNELFVALHGSWNRDSRTGYKVIRVHFDANGKAVGSYEDFLVGWSDNPDGKEVWGRPVGLAQLTDGSLLVTDDGANKIWRIAYTGPPSKVTAEGKLPVQWGHVKTLAVLPSFPNPANPEIWVPFVLGTEASVSLNVYDVQGALVRTVQFGKLGMGVYTERDRAAYWDGRNASGESVATGAYFLELLADSARSKLQQVVIRK